MIGCMSMESHLNVGYGEEISIYDLAVKIANIVGFKGQINFDSLNLIFAKMFK